MSIESTYGWGRVEKSLEYRQVPYRADRPFNDLPPLPPAVDLGTRPVLKACIAAREAMAGARLAARLIPSPDILLNAIPLLEARASSEIENIVTTTDRLFRFANDPDSRADPATREALRYLRTLVDLGILTEQRAGRENLFLNPRLLALLSDRSA